MTRSIGRASKGFVAAQVAVTEQRVQQQAQNSSPTTDTTQQLVPPGVIVMWSGTLASVPQGWALCDGAGGRPDLRERFILGWKAGVNPGATGGATTHKHGKGTLAVAADAHTTTAVQSGAGTNVVTGPATHTNTVSGDTAASVAETDYPPFYTLAFIIKTA